MNGLIKNYELKLKDCHLSVDFIKFSIPFMNF